MMWRTASRVSFENLTACSVIFTQQGTEPHLWKCPNIYTPNTVLTHERRVLLSLNVSLTLNLLLSFTVSFSFECLVITLSFTLYHYVQRVYALNAAWSIHVVISTVFWTSAALIILWSLNCWFFLGHWLV